MIGDAITLDRATTHAELILLLVEQAYRVGYCRGTHTAIHALGYPPMAEDVAARFWEDMATLQCRWVDDVAPDGAAIKGIVAKFPADERSLGILALGLRHYTAAEAATVFAPT